MASEPAYLIHFRIFIPSNLPAITTKTANKQINLYSCHKTRTPVGDGMVVDCTVPDGFARLLIADMMKLGIEINHINKEV